MVAANNVYQEIVIENTLTKKNGEEVHLKPGAEVKVTIEAGPKGFWYEKQASLDGAVTEKSFKR